MVGSLEQLYQKTQTLKQENQELTDKLETSTKLHSSAQQRVENLERQVAYEREEVERKTEISRTEQSRTEDVSDEPNRQVRLGRLEGENVLLRSSLQDIALMVEDSTDGPRASRPRPVTPSRSLARRTRSASPAMIESTVTAVQTVLKKRQLEVHQLSLQQQQLEDKLRQLGSSETKLSTRNKDLTGQLAAAKQQLAAVKKEVCKELQITLTN